jgi:hypothetical protein
MSVIDEVAAERVRQIEQEGWSAEHDDGHTDGSLAKAAAAYCWGHRWASGSCQVGHQAAAELWPWDVDWWKPKNRRRDLIRAAALIVAEIERLDRRESAAKAAA